ncbi:uncharacterized protein LOC100202370 [Hydra vulgaris]|uniref:uncharacterized protein LOC100202370 n=1 Tax=Hydra vulgaris TaxID=6087 RepID=UPI0001923934|nr:uncharacterized protein LOC100202370 [Hydra vulgaris]
MTPLISWLYFLVSMLFVQPLASAVIPEKYYIEPQDFVNDVQDKFISKREAPFRDDLEDNLFPSDKEQEFLEDPYQPVFYITEGADSNDDTDADDKDLSDEAESGDAVDGNNESGSESGESESGSNESESKIIDDASKQDIEIKN